MKGSQVGHRPRMGTRDHLTESQIVPHHQDCRKVVKEMMGPRFLAQIHLRHKVLCQGYRMLQAMGRIKEGLIDHLWAERETRGR